MQRNLSGAKGRIALAIAAIFGACLFAPGAWAVDPLPFFPGAEGFGGVFAGTPPSGGWFANATVYHVTNLNNDGAGSLRGAFAENTSNKIIVFDVGGTIQLGSGSSNDLDIKNLNNYYIAGQTAPSPVTIYGNMSQISHSNNKEQHNIILRYLTFRKGTGDGEDSLSFVNGGPNGIAGNMILDHVSVSWAEDENLSIRAFNTNITVQNSIISDALTSDHAYGSLLRPNTNANMTLARNLYANQKSRQPKAGSYEGAKLTLDFVNNVIYNWTDRAGYAGGEGNDPELVDMNYVGNYLIAGPSTPNGQKSNTAFSKEIPDDGHALTLKVYQGGNVIDSNKNTSRDGSDTGWGMFVTINTNGSVTAFPEADKSATRFATNTDIDPTHAGVTPYNTPVTTASAVDAYNHMLSYVGNYWWSRDIVDARIINNVINTTNPPNGVGAAAPNAAELAAVLNAPMTTHPVGWDTDGDTMPDWWEIKHGLNPNSAADQKLDFDNDGYINILEYINERGETPCPAPIEFMTSGGVDGNYAKILNWKTNDGTNNGTVHWQPSKYDEARIVGTSTVVVDAAGQHAGALIIGANSGDNATVQITGGWLEVAGKTVGGIPTGLQIGTASSQGHLQLSGGVLSTPVLDKQGPGSSFSFTGGVLHAGLVTFDLANQGGTLSPGNSIGQTIVDGNLDLLSGILEIELASDSPSGADSLLVTGEVTLGGSLSVIPILGFAPDDGDSWEIITSGGIDIDGIFSSITSGYSVQKQGGDLRLFFGTVLDTSGDLNDDGFVDDQDIDILWNVIRPELAGSDDPGANDDEDLNGDGFVNEDDVDYMLANLLDAGTNRQYGDADLDGGVGGLDYTAWRQRAGTGWANGDFDGDGGVGGLDYTLWRTRPTVYPSEVGPHAGGVQQIVPEPSSAILTGLAGVLLVVLRWRRLV